MRAAVLYETNTPLRVEDVQLEGPRAGEVQVGIVAAGVCHSDLSVLQGNLPCALPCVLGHEGAGIVEEVGAGVDHVSPGDHVVLNWRPSCGRCYFCLIGRPAVCDHAIKMRSSGRLLDGSSRLRIGDQELRHFSAVSTFADRVVTVASGVLKIRTDVPLDKVAIVGCGVLTGVGAVLNAAQLRPGQSAVVIGCGGVGLNAIQGCAIAGAEIIIAVDVSDFKLDLARQFGATHVLNANRDNVVAAVRELTGGLGAEFAFEVIGNVKTLAQAIDCVRRTGTVVAVGMPREDQLLELAVRKFVAEDKTLKGSIFGSADPALELPKVLDLYVAGKLKLDQLISREYPLEHINDAFSALEKGEVARSIITFN